MAIGPKTPSAFQVDWQKSVEKDVFRVSFPSYSVAISERANHNEAPLFVIQVLDEVGDVIEEVNDEDFRSTTYPAYKVFRNLVSLARSKALGLADAVSSLLKSLNAIDPTVPQIVQAEDEGITDDDVPF